MRKSDMELAHALKGAYAAIAHVQALTAELVETLPASEPRTRKLKAMSKDSKDALTDFMVRLKALDQAMIARFESAAPD